MVVIDKFLVYICETAMAKYVVRIMFIGKLPTALCLFTHPISTFIAWVCDDIYITFITQFIFIHYRIPRNRPCT